MNRELIAALDIGKTHARLSLIDPQAGVETWHTKCVVRALDTPIGRQLPVASIERWLIDTLRHAPERERISAILPIAHGAAAVLLDEQGQILAAPDYEDSQFEGVTKFYEAERDPFAQTFSPALPLGLNLGKQLFFMEQQHPQIIARWAQLLLYPQFWAWRLSGVMASELTSLGCHTDLWRPQGIKFSALADRRAWSPRVPARRFAGETLGPAIGPLAQAAGLSPDCRVLCGLHDSNASYLRYLLTRRHESFAVLSSGTWTVAMANQVALERLKPEQDMLANVDVFGSPVATARFMGGREYEAIARTPQPATYEALRNVLNKGAMALPAFAAGGPFAGSTGELRHGEGLVREERAALATLYVALMSDVVLESLGVSGDVIIDGPLATNAFFAPLLASLRPGCRVYTDGGKCGLTALSYLAGVTQERDAALDRVEPIRLELLREYRELWRQRVANR